MSYDPTQQVPPPQNYPPQPNYPPPAPQPAYPPPAPQVYPPPYTQQGYPPAPAPQTYPQYGTPPPPPGAGFDFNTIWRNLGQAGKVASISGLVLFVLLFLPWFDVSATCNGSLCAGVTDKNYSYNAFGVIGTVRPGNATETYSFPLMIVVILAAVALIAIPVIGAMGKMAAKQVQMFMLIAAGLAVLLEIIFMFTAFGSFPDETGSQTFEGTTIRVAAGPAVGFWLGLLATLVAGGMYLYFGYIKKPALPYQQALPYPGSQPQYPGSQPQYPGSQPQYPGSQPQYPGSQPPYQPPTQYQQPAPLPPTQYQPPPPPPPPYPGQ